MSRKPRFVLPGVPQHVIQRRNNRKSFFILTMTMLVNFKISKFQNFKI